MKKYALYDNYETEIEPGELICTSDDYAEIKAAAKQRVKDTDGDAHCGLLKGEMWTDKEQKTLDELEEMEG